MVYFLANVKKSDLSLWINISPDNPWNEILDSWCKYNFKEHHLILQVHEILGQTIWYNSCIRVGGKSIFYKSWYIQGIHYISDLIKGNRWKTIPELTEEFGITPMLLEYLGILNALEKNWRRILKDENYNEYRGEIYIPNVHRICQLDKVNKVVYLELTRRKCEIPTDRWQSWLTELKVEINELDWLDCLPRIHTYTTSTRLRALGYRFLVRDVLTNNKLIHMKKTDSILCYLCKSETETISHLYWECAHTKRLWERLKLFIFDNLDWEIDLNPVETLMGVTREETSEEMPLLFNLLCLITKNYIHSCKCRNKIPDERGLIWNIIYVRNMEFDIAQKKGKGAILRDARKWLNLMKYDY